MTVREWLEGAEKSLRLADISTARLDSLLLLELATKEPRTSLLAGTLVELKPRILTKANKLLARRLQRVPLAYLSRQQEFYGLGFKIDESVLIPRPESESLVELAIKHAPRGGSLLDLGTGSGCLAISIAKYRPDLKVQAADISIAALKLAEQNIKKHRVKVALFSSDLLSNASQDYEVIVANLPYLPERRPISPEAAYEPQAALFGGVDGLKYYRQLFEEVAANSLLIIEAELSEHPPLMALAKENQFRLLDKQGLGLAFSSLVA